MKRPLLTSPRHLPIAREAPRASRAPNNRRRWYFPVHLFHGKKYRENRKDGRGSGNVTEYSTGNPSSTPAGIAYCDGTSWWFTDPGANAIGRITSLGGTTYYPVPSTGAQPTEISSTYGGGLWWFTEPGVNKIASLDGNGNITEYASPAKPVEIVADQDAVHVLTDAGTIEEFDPVSGALRHTYTPPASTAGPAVGIFEGYSSLIILRSDGTHGSIQDFYYE